MIPDRLGVHLLLVAGGDEGGIGSLQAELHRESCNLELLTECAVGMRLYDRVF